MRVAYRPVRLSRNDASRWPVRLSRSEPQVAPTGVGSPTLSSWSKDSESFSSASLRSALRLQDRPMRPPRLRPAAPTRAPCAPLLPAALLLAALRVAARRTTERYAVDFGATFTDVGR
jgi:hypothetical protein